MNSVATQNGPHEGGRLFHARSCATLLPKSHGGGFCDCGYQGNPFTTNSPDAMNRAIAVDRAAQKENPMAATPAPIDKDLQKQLEGLTPADLQTATALAKDLRNLEDWTKGMPTRMQTEIAADAMKDAGRIRKIIWDGDTADVQKAFELHRSLTAKRTKRVAFFDRVVEVAKRIIGIYQTEQRRLADEARRAAENEQRRIAEEQRQANADALAAEAAATNDAELMQAAIEVESAPVIPVAVPEAAPSRVEGSSVSFKLVGDVKDAKALLMFLVEGKREDLINEIVEFRQAGINAALKRGLELPGVTVSKVPLVRNMGR